MTSDKTDTIKAQALVTTYLEMRAAPEPNRHGSAITNQKFVVRELTERDWKFNREMYFKVGENWKWIDKRPWSDEQWKEYANDPNLRTFGGYCGDEIAGYFELKRTMAGEQRTEDREQIEIAYFGLLPEFIGRGFGGALLTRAIENAWS